MKLRNNHNTYGLVAQILHWVVGFMIIAVFIMGKRMEELEDELGRRAPEVAELASLHKSLGIIIFLLVIARLLWAWLSVKPKPLHNNKKYEAILAKIVHWGLYIIALALPLSGWLGNASSPYKGELLIPFGNTLPLIPQDRGLSRMFYEVHESLVVVLLILFALHIIGTLKHLIIDRDDTLKRMVPFWYRDQDDNKAP